MMEPVDGKREQEHGIIVYGSSMALASGGTVRRPSLPDNGGKCCYLHHAG